VTTLHGMPATALTHPDEWPVYSAQAQGRAAELIARGRTFDYGHGPELAELERDFATRHHRRYAMALGSGTAALYAAFFALGFGPGDEVIVPDYTFFSTATPLFLLGAVPILADSRSPDGTVDPAAVAALVGPRTVGLVMTHLWGHPCDMRALLELARTHKLAVVEDCSHAHGSTYHGLPVGSACDIAVFSVGGHKAISGGMGGMLLTDSEDLYARACLLANFRHRTDLTIGSPDYAPWLTTGLGGNYRMSPVAAVLAHSHLTDLDRYVANRLANVGALAKRIGALAGIRAVPVAPGCTMGAWYDGVVEVTPDCRYSRDELVSILRADGLKVRAPASRPLHTYPLFQGAAPHWSPLAAAAARVVGPRNDRPFPVSDQLFAHWLMLPVNFLWDDDGAIVEPYVAAFERVLP
jgi:perosamine synthetase